MSKSAYVYILAREKNGALGTALAPGWMDAATPGAGTPYAQNDDTI